MGTLLRRIFTPTFQQRHISSSSLQEWELAKLSTKQGIKSAYEKGLSGSNYFFGEPRSWAPRPKNITDLSQVGQPNEVESWYGGLDKRFQRRQMSLPKL